MNPEKNNREKSEPRVMKAARTKAEIKEAARKGFRPLVKKIVPSDKIRSQYCVVQNRNTGEIEVIGDLRAGRYFPEERFETVIDWTYHHPYSWPLPYAAYLIPPDIRLGERVPVEDLIEDYIGETWSKGSVYRLESCEAIRNGVNLEIQHDPRKNGSNYIG